MCAGPASGCCMHVRCRANLSSCTPADGACLHTSWQSVRLPVCVALLASASLSPAALPPTHCVSPADVLEMKGGIKCVLRRTDHGQPEWIKAG